MKYKYSVKYGGVIYPAGVHVPEKNVETVKHTVEPTVKTVAADIEEPETQKRKGRPKKE